MSVIAAALRPERMAPTKAAYVAARKMRNSYELNSIACLRSFHPAGAVRGGPDIGDTLAGQLIGAFIEVVARVAAHPVPMDGVAINRRIEALPQIGVLHRLLVGGLPAVAFPA